MNQSNYTLDRIVETIVPMVDPSQIILFGSHARGDYTDKSDIDLLILKKGLKNKRETTQNLYMALCKNNIDVAVDLLALDYDRYHEISDTIGLVYKTIKKEGKIIYDNL